MEEHNPYQSPRAAVTNELAEEMLAGRGERLGAVIIDGLISLAIGLPLMFATGYFDYMRNGLVMPITVMLVAAVAGFVLFALVQGYPLHTAGQTWGKRLLGIKIVNLDGTNPGLGKLLTRRFLPIQAIGAIPLIGMIFSLTDTLMIFRGDRRCLHDLIAGTRVVTAR